MRNGLTWLTLGIGWVLVSTVSCGKDEATSPGGKTGRIAHCEGCRHTNECASGNICKVVAGTLGVCATAAETSCCDDATPPNCYPSLGGNIDGSGGSGGGGVINNGGKSGKGGSGGSGATTSVGSRLGQACVRDEDCGVDSGMTCLLSDGIDGAGPAKGMCTAPCSVSNSSACLDIAEDSYCYPLTETDSYCIEGCVTGALGVPKCHQRTEVACSIIGFIPSEAVSCQDSDDCGEEELCDQGFCKEMLTGCVPTCGGDFDCGDGQFCDFASGLCTDTKPTGLAPGSFCDPQAVPDPCNGFCLGGTEPDEGECSAICSFNEGFTGCGWDGTGVAETPVCLFATRVEPDVAPGDLMLCGTLCDCNSQCQLSTDICIDETEEKFVKQIWGREGYCRGLAPDETMADTIRVCPDGTSSGGTGGEGGQPSGSGGTSGDGGQSGGGGQAGG
jgi:hypothetical protein